MCYFPRYRIDDQIPLHDAELMSAGGGIWVSFLHRSNTLSLAYARSPESNGFYVRAGFLY